MATRSRMTRSAIANSGEKAGQSDHASNNAIPTTTTAGTGTGDETGNPCVICFAAPSKKIVRDTNFQKVMHLFLDGCLGVDVKPLESAKFELCDECYELLGEFYDTDDAISQIEKHFKKVRRDILSRTLQGIQCLKKKGKPILPIHEKITSSWGEDPNKLGEMLKAVELVKLQ